MSVSTLVGVACMAVAAAGLTAQGRVTTKDGFAVEGAVVGLGVHRVTTDEDGRFEVQVADGAGLQVSVTSQAAVVHAVQCEAQAGAISMYPRFNTASQLADIQLVLPLVVLRVAVEARGVPVEGVRGKVEHLTGSRLTQHVVHAGTGPDGVLCMAVSENTTPQLALTPPPAYAPATVAVDVGSKAVYTTVVLQVTGSAVFGRLVTASNYPIAGAVVTVSQRTVVTGADGRFVVDDVPHTPYAAVFLDGGYAAYVVSELGEAAAGGFVGQAGPRFPHNGETDMGDVTLDLARVTLLVAASSGSVVSDAVVELQNNMVTAPTFTQAGLRAVSDSNGLVSLVLPTGTTPTLLISSPSLSARTTFKYPGPVHDGGVHTVHL